MPDSITLAYKTVLYHETTPVCKETVKCHQQAQNLLSIPLNFFSFYGHLAVNHRIFLTVMVKIEHINIFVI